MAKKDLEGRKNWQTSSGPAGKAGIAEQDLISVFEEAFRGTDYVISEYPTDFKHLYENVMLSEEVLSEIYNPDEETMARVKKRGWGVFPDFSITNIKTEKTIFGEIKRQDGWVEGGKPNDGRGNAHERLCKLFTPGLMRAYREKSKITDKSILSFWIVLEGDITRDPKRNRELAYWFAEFDKNYFMWRPGVGGEALLEHFDKYLKNYLD